jgi:hypoxia up-regulated 1
VNCALLGVDFGTEYTKAILVAPGVPFDILLTSESKRKDVSGLAIEFDTTNNKNVKVHRKFGTQALSTCIKTPQSCMLYLKPLLGIGSANPIIYEYSDKFPGNKIGIQNGREATTVLVASKDGSHEETYLVEEAIAMILIEIKNRALEYWKERSPDTLGTIDELVISVPRHFNEASRIALTDAAELAGLKVVALVDDGLAIALDYAQKRNDIKENTKEYHLIFDSGAGSTKTSLVSIANLNGTINVEIENYASNSKFNGELFTMLVKKLILEQFSQNSGISLEDLVYDPKVMQKVWQVAEKTKLILSANTETNVNIESFYNDIDFKGFITRQSLESEIEAALPSIPNMLDIVLEGFDKNDLKSVILAGGSVRVPIIQDTLIKYFGNENILSKNVNADESVVFGTTLRGAQIMKLTRKKQINIIDHSPFQYDIVYKKPDESIKGVINVPKGMLANEKVTVNLAEFENQYLPEIQVDIFENSQALTHKFNFTIPKKFNETTCEGGIEYILNYGFSKSDIFTVNNIKVNCYSLVNDTVSNIPKTGNMPFTSQYFGFEPMPSSMKKKSIVRFNTYEKMDLELQHVSDTKNKLEATLYEIRYILEELEDLLPHDLLAGFSTNVTEFLEWLDYESEDAHLSDILTKLQLAHDMKHNAKKFGLVGTLESALEHIKIPYEKLIEKKDSILKDIDNILNKDKNVLEECANHGINFEKQLKKLYGSSYPPLEILLKKPEDWLSTISKHVEILNNTNQEDFFTKLNSTILVDVLDIISNTEKELDKIGNTFKSVFENRNTFLAQQIASVKKAAKRAELENEKAKMNAENEEKPVEELKDDGHNDETKESGTDDIKHDEL